MKNEYILSIRSIGKTCHKSQDIFVLVGDGEQVLVDVEGKDYKEITQHVKKILGKSE